MLFAVKKLLKFLKLLALFVPMKISHLVILESYTQI